MKRLKRELEPFDNMWEQNLAIYGVVLFSALLIEFIVNIDLVHRLVSLFFPMSHYYTMFNGLFIYSLSYRGGQCAVLFGMNSLY